MKHHFIVHQIEWALLLTSPIDRSTINMLQNVHILSIIKFSLDVQTNTYFL